MSNCSLTRLRAEGSGLKPEREGFRLEGKFYDWEEYWNNFLRNIVQPLSLEVFKNRTDFCVWFKSGAAQSWRKAKELYFMLHIYFEDLLKSISSFQILETKDLCYSMTSLIFKIFFHLKFAIQRYISLCHLSIYMDLDLYLLYIWLPSHFHGERKNC